MLKLPNEPSPILGRLRRCPPDNCAATHTPISPLPPTPAPSMNRLDHSRPAILWDLRPSSETPRLPPPLRAFALKFTASTFRSLLRVEQAPSTFPAHERQISRLKPCTLARSMTYSTRDPRGITSPAARIVNLPNEPSPIFGHLAPLIRRPRRYRLGPAQANRRRPLSIPRRCPPAPPPPLRPVTGETVMTTRFLRLETLLTLPPTVRTGKMEDANVNFVPVPWEPSDV
jgi:hypothetical protein